MTPAQLQAFLNTVFSRLTDVISAHRGTVDKYMGDCVMAFWGAPIDAPEHAALAVRAALDMADAVRDINEANRAGGRPEISVGIGINSGVMSVGDMGSAARRSYTVVGDAVNLASRLEGLSGHYGVEIVASGATRELAPGYVWQELDSVRVKGKAQAVPIYQPLAHQGELSADLAEELAVWEGFLRAYAAQEWAQCDKLMARLRVLRPRCTLYELYAARVEGLPPPISTPSRRLYMKVRVLGCSGAIAKDCRTTSFLIGESILLDAGTGVGDLTLEEMGKIDH
eukprot:gene51663-69136_t